MIRKIRQHILVLASLLMLAVPTLAMANASASCATNIGSGINSGINDTSGNKGVGYNADCNQTSANNSITNIAKTIINIFSIIVGIVSVFMIIYAGFRYITSGGDSGNTTGARNTLLYAIVGLIIVAIAQVIVRFVLSTANGIK